MAMHHEHQKLQQHAKDQASAPNLGIDTGTDAAVESEVFPFSHYCNWLECIIADSGDCIFVVLNVYGSKVLSCVPKICIL